uniref:TPT domain-containing protein n=2 Tax=Caenorhabditis tropicalis TaxID=1561998 RepID=A0A1I7U876_9PELO
MMKKQMNIVLNEDSESGLIPEDEEGNLKMAVGATNIRKKMMYSRKVFAVISSIFLVYAIGNMTLFITPGVREFVQQYRLIYLCAPLPIISKLLLSGVERMSHPPRFSFLIPSFLLHLLAIFLSITSLSLYLDTELVYFSCFVVFINMCQLLLYTLQNYSILSASKMLLLLTVTTSVNSFSSQLFFPYSHSHTSKLY